MDARELSREEKRAIRKLVTSMCANFDKEYGCLPLDCECYMLGKCWTGAYCRYFQNAVLPLNPALELALTSATPAEMRSCTICGKAFPQDGKRAYCSDACTSLARRKRQRDYMRQKRG